MRRRWVTLVTLACASISALGLASVDVKEVTK